jgi:hypothetical protein
VEFTYYRAGYVHGHELPGMKRFKAYFKVVGPGVMPLDRTG